MGFEVVTIGDCTLYRGRCEDILPAIGEVDAFIFSPPYNLGTTTGGGFPRLGHYGDDAKLRARGGGGKWKAASRDDGLGNGYGAHSDAMPHDEYVGWQKAILLQCWSQLSGAGAIFYNHKPRVLGGRCVTPLEYNPQLPVRQIVIWARAGGINFSPAFYLPTHEWVVVFAKDDYRLRDKAASGAGDVWYIPQEHDKDHPCSFPVRLPETIIETNSFQLACDPFMGVGGTGQACVRHGRKFIGIEREQRYFDEACKRIEAEYARTALFDPKPEPLVQGSLLND